MPLGDTLRESLTARLPAKLAALGASVLLWLVVSGEEPTTTWVTVRVAPLLDGSARLAARPPRVRARVTGPARELLVLSTQPPVLRRPITARAPDTLRLDLLPEDVELPPGVTRVRVRELKPRSIVLRLAPSATGASARPARLATP